MTRRRTRRAAADLASDTQEATDYETTLDTEGEHAADLVDAGGDAAGRTEKQTITDEETQSDTEIPPHRTQSRADSTADTDVEMAELPQRIATTTDDDDERNETTRHNGQSTPVQRHRSQDFSGSSFRPGATAPSRTLAAATGDMRGALAARSRAPGGGAVRYRTPITGSTGQLSTHVSRFDDHVASHSQRVESPRQGNGSFSTCMHTAASTHNVHMHSQEHSGGMTRAPTSAATMASSECTHVCMYTQGHNDHLQEPTVRVHDVVMSDSQHVPLPVATTAQRPHATLTNTIAPTNRPSVSSSTNHQPRPVHSRTSVRPPPTRKMDTDDTLLARNLNVTDGHGGRRQITRRDGLHPAYTDELEDVHRRRHERAQADIRRARSNIERERDTETYQRVMHDLEEHSAAWIPTREQPIQAATLQLVLEEVQASRKEREEAQKKSREATQAAADQRRRAMLRKLDYRPEQPYPTTEEDSDLDLPQPRLRRALAEAQDEFKRYGRVRIRNRRPGDERHYVDEQYLSSDATMGHSIYSTSQEATPEVENRFAGRLTDGQTDDYEQWPLRKMRRAIKHLRQQSRADGAPPTKRHTLPRPRRTPFQPIKARDAYAYQCDGQYITDVEATMKSLYRNQRPTKYCKDLMRDLGVPTFGSMGDLTIGERTAASEGENARKHKKTISRDDLRQHRRNDMGDQPRGTRYSTSNNYRVPTTQMDKSTRGYHSETTRGRSHHRRGYHSETTRGRSHHRHSTSGSETETEARVRRRAQREPTMDERAHRRAHRYRDDDYSAQSSEEEAAAAREPSNCSRRRAKLPSLSGNDWTSFRIDFERVANENNWTPGEKASALCAALQQDPNAARILQDEDTLRWSYDKLVRVMEARYSGVKKNKTERKQHQHNNRSSSSESDNASIKPKTRSKMRVKLPPFSGSNWASFKNGFEKAAQQNGWTEDEKASALYVAIQQDSVASKALQGEDTLQWDYNKLVQTMESRYGRNKTWADVMPEAKQIERLPTQPLPQYYDRIMHLLSRTKISAEQARFHGFHIYLNGLNCSRQMLNEVMNKVRETTIDEIHKLCMDYEAVHGLSHYEPNWTYGVNMVRAAEDVATQATPIASLPAYQPPPPTHAVPNAATSSTPTTQHVPAPAPAEPPLPSFVNAFMTNRQQAPNTQRYRQPAPPQLPPPAYNDYASYPQYQPAAPAAPTPAAFAPTAPAPTAPVVSAQPQTIDANIMAENERLRREVQDTKAHYNKRLDFFDRRIRKMEGRPPPEEQPNRSQAERANHQGGRRDNYRRNDNYNRQNNYQGQQGGAPQQAPPQQAQQAGPPPPATQYQQAPQQQTQQTGPQPPTSQYQQVPQQQRAQNDFAQTLPLPADGIYRRDAQPNNNTQQQSVPVQQPAQQAAAQTPTTAAPSTQPTQQA